MRKKKKKSKKMTDGEQIAAERVRLGMTQVQLADAIQVTGGLISHYEVGRKKIPYRSLLAIRYVFMLREQQIADDKRKKAS